MGGSADKITDTACFMQLASTKQLRDKNWSAQLRSTIITAVQIILAAVPIANDKYRTVISTQNVENCFLPEKVEVLYDP